jgi:hypothetical protein
MVRLSKKKRGGEFSLQMNNSVEKALDTANQLVKQLKEIEATSNTNAYGLENPSDNSFMDMNNYNNEPALDINSDYGNVSNNEMPAFKNPNTSIKFSTPMSRITLTYPRIISHLNDYIRKNPNNNRTIVMKELLKNLEYAMSKEEVEQILRNTDVTLKGNYVMGGKTKRRMGGKTKKRKGGKSKRRN